MSRAPSGTFRPPYRNEKQRGDGAQDSRYSHPINTDEFFGTHSRFFPLARYVYKLILNLTDGVIDVLPAKAAGTNDEWPTVS